jgi:hypothetical protein
MTDKSRFIGLIITLICVSSNVYSADKIYTSNFSLTESRISEGEKWINGAATGIDWTNVKTSNGNTTGTQVRYPDRLYYYDDSVAILKGTWGADQSVEGVVYLANQTNGGASGFGSYNGVDCNKEVEFILRGTITPNHLRMYAIALSSRQDGTAYVETGSWIGGINDYWLANSFSHKESTDYILSNGDTVKVSIVGNRLNVYKNNTLIDSVDVTVDQFGSAIDYISSGSPGIGFYSGMGCTGTDHNDDFGFTSVTATAPETTATAPETRIPSSPSIISIK